MVPASPGGISCRLGLSPRQRRSPSMSPVLALESYAETGSPGLPRVESTGLRPPFTDDPRAEFPLASSGCEAPAVLPWPLAPERPTATARRPDACASVAARLRPDPLAANRTQPNRARPKCGPSARPGSPSWSASVAAADPAYSRQVRSSSVIESLPRHRGPSIVGGPTTRPPRETGSMVPRGIEWTDGVPFDAQPEALGYAGQGFPNGVCPRVPRGTQRA